jgi:hypothetical protein
VAEEMMHHFNVARFTSHIKGCRPALSKNVDVDVCAAEKLTHHINVAHLTSHM